MTSPDFPGGSPENPAIIPDTEANEEPSPSDFADGSRDEPMRPIMSNEELTRTCEVITAELTPSEMRELISFMDEFHKQGISRSKFSKSVKLLFEKQLQLDEDGKTRHLLILESDSDDDQAPPNSSPPFAMSKLDVLCDVVQMYQEQELKKQREREATEEKRRVLEAERAKILQEQEKLQKQREREATKERWRVWEEEKAASDKQYVYEVAKAYALELHSDQSPNLFQNQSEDDEDSEEEEEEEEDKGKEKSRFLDAKKAIKKRRRDLISSTSGIDLSLVTAQRKAPTLTELSMRALAKHSEAIKSLHLVPDHLKKKLTDLVSDSSKFDKRFMQLLIQDSPSEISAKNCVEIEEKDLTRILSDCDRDSLEALNLGLCGKAMTEQAMTEFLRRSPNGFPSLTTLSLQGAFSLTDKALALISRSAPLLQHINLSDCSLLTFKAVKILADNFGSTLRGLYIGGCQGIKSSHVFRRSLCKFEKLNSLSVAGLENIHDVFIDFLVSRGCNLTDLSIASCNGFDDMTIWIIGRLCPNLEALDISEMDDLTEESLKEIAEGCRYLRSVKLTRNRFSDLAVAAFLEVCGGSLNQLCLNNVRDVGQYTAILLAQNCKRLHYLDLSWCRKLTEEELRRILRCCSLLRSLKLFGWTQVKDEFLEELSRSQVHIVGLKMTSIFAHPDDSYPSVDAKFF